MPAVSESEVLLLWRALRQFRTGKTLGCAPRGRPPGSNCPLYANCGRWNESDDYQLSLEETLEQTERRRAVTVWSAPRVARARHVANRLVLPSIW
jgi:hypothetical protein